jgi:rubrerythrin
VQRQLKRLISRARRLEALSMSIYVGLAKAFPEPAELHEFWMSMARHEAGHVGALELLEVMIEQTGQPGELPDIRAAADTAEAAIERMQAEAEGPLTLHRAFELAIELESVEVEDLVFDLYATLADPEQRDQAEKMLVHDLSALSLMIEKYAGDDSLLARADALVERHVGRRSQRRGSAPAH